MQNKLKYINQYESAETFESPVYEQEKIQYQDV